MDYFAVCGLHIESLEKELTTGTLNNSLRITCQGSLQITFIIQVYTGYFVYVII